MPYNAIPCPQFRRRRAQALLKLAGAQHCAPVGVGTEPEAEALDVQRDARHTCLSQLAAPLDAVCKE